MQRLAGLLFLCSAIGLSGCNQPAPKIQTVRHEPKPDVGVPLGRLSQVAIPRHYTIALKIDPAAERFTGHAEIEVDFRAPKRVLYLHGLDLNVSGVSVKLPSGQSFAAHYDQVDRSGVARLVFVDRVPKGIATLIFDYDAPYGRSLSGIYKVTSGDVPYVFSQFESTDARRAFPSFDEPGFKTPFDITIIAPAADKVVGNTPIVSASRIKKGFREFVLQTTRPLPTYLIALAIGPLDIVDGGDIPASRYRDHPLHLRGVTSRGNGPRIAYALSQTGHIIQALENYFGIGYPYPKLDIIAVPDFAAGAMENAGAVTFRERLLLMGPDASIEQRRGTISVQAHEFAHQWFGDLVTPAWWNDIWLNESFANWMGNKASIAVGPELGFETDPLHSGFEVMNLDELPSARAIRQPVNNVDDLGNAFDSITYNKGASVLRMFEAYVGPDAWQRGVHAYLTKFAFGNATAQDFIGTIASTTHHPELVSAFFGFITQSGVPNLHANGVCTANKLDLSLAAYAPIGATPPSRSWHLPVCVSQAGLATCHLMTGAALSVPVASDCKTPPLLNPSGAGYYRYALDEAGWRGQIATLATLAPTDQMTVLNNVDAAMRSGQASAADFLAAVQALAPTARWDVLRSINERLRALRLGLAPSDLVTYRAFVSRNFAGRLSTLGLATGPAETSDISLAREYLARLLVSEAHDAYVIAELSTAIRGNKPLAPELKAEAFRAALLADPGYGGDLLNQFKTANDEDLRQKIIYAFAGSSDQRVALPLFGLALTPATRQGELRYLYENFGQESTARTVFWPWLTAHFQAMAKRQSLFYMRGPVQVLENTCDSGLRSGMDRFLAPYVGQIQGGSRRLAETDEMIDRCVAFRNAKGTEVSAALAAATR